MAHLHNRSPGEVSTGIGSGGRNRANAGIANVPAASGSVKVDGRVITTASAHDYVPGSSLLATDQVDDGFFPRLTMVLSQLHEHGVAYVDLHKRDNILVDDKGVPHLIDFQISVHLPAIWPFSSVLHMLQRCDRYHLAKHMLHFRPDQCEESVRRSGQQVRHLRAGRVSNSYW